MLAKIIKKFHFQNIMQTFGAVLILAACMPQAVVYGAMNPEKDDMRQFQEIVFENGYQLEHYSLVTKDDYLVTLYRIPGKFAEAKTAPASNKPAVLMLHSQDWDMT